MNIFDVLQSDKTVKLVISPKTTLNAALQKQHWFLFSVRKERRHPIHHNDTLSHLNVVQAWQGWMHVCVPEAIAAEVYVVLAYLLLEAAVPPFRPQITKVFQGK